MGNAEGDEGSPGPFLEFAESRLHGVSSSAEEYAQALKFVGDAYALIGGRYSRRAEQAYIMYSKKVESIFGRDSLEASDSFIHIASFLASKTVRQYEKAMAYTARALVIRGALLGHEHQMTAAAHFNLALLLRVTGDLDGAIREYTFAMQGRRKSQGNLSLGVADAYVSLGLCHHMQSEFRKAEIK